MSERQANIIRTLIGIRNSRDKRLRSIVRGLIHQSIRTVKGQA